MRGRMLLRLRASEASTQSISSTSLVTVGNFTLLVCPSPLHPWPLWVYGLPFLRFTYLHKIVARYIGNAQAHLGKLATTLITLIQARTGHCRLNSSIHPKRPRDSARCEYGKGHETIKRVLLVLAQRMQRERVRVASSCNVSVLDMGKPST